MFRIKQRHILGTIQGKIHVPLCHGCSQNIMHLSQETKIWNNGTCILPEICRFGVQNVKLAKIQPRRFNGLEKT